MSDYALRLSDPEVERYRRQAGRSSESESDLWEQAGVVEGADVVDLGCGPGAVLAQIASVVGPTGSVTGVDQDPAALARARTDLAGAGTANVTLREATVPGAGLSPGSFDVVMMRHLLVHNGGREQAIVDDAVGLLRPGGAVYLVDTDLTMMRIQPPAAPVTELYERYEQFQRSRGNDPRIGVRLADLLTGAGLEVIEFRGTCNVMFRRSGARGPAWAAREAMVADGIAAPAEIDRWAEEFDRLDAAAVQPRYVLCGFTAVARRP